VTSWSERRRDEDAEWRHERDAAQRAVCPWCGRPAGKTCVNKYTGVELKGAPAHWQRTLAASELDDEEGP
jgi:hypothetical protein